jgi:hypothetical protein
MARGKASDDAGRDLEHLSSAIFQVRPKNLEDLYQNALRLLTVIADNRGERLDSADGSVPYVVRSHRGRDHYLELSGLFRRDQSLGVDAYDGDACRTRRAGAAARTRHGLSLYRGREDFGAAIRRGTRSNAPEFADSLGCKTLDCSFSCRLGRSAGLWRAARFVSVGDHHGKLSFSVAIGAIMKKTIDS